MKIRLLYFTLLSWLSLIGAMAQTTVTIGTGSSTTGSFDNGSPVYRSSSTSGFDFSQSLIMYTEDDLATVGIFDGAVISSLSFYKSASSGAITAGESANLNVSLGNGFDNSLDTAATFSNLTTGFTSVFSGSVDDTVFSSASQVTIAFQNNFTYNGGSIIVAMDWGISAPATPTTGFFQWLYDDATPGIQARGNSNSSAITADMIAPRNRLYQADFTYTGGTPPSCIKPNTVTASNITMTSVDISWVEGDAGTTSYEVLVVPTGTGPTGTPTQTGITGTSTTISTLTSGEVYDAFVRAVCSGTDTSSYSVPVTFRIPGPGDACTTPISLTVNAFGDCSTVYNLDFDTSIDLGTADASCDATGVNTGKWFEFTAPASASIPSVLYLNTVFVIIGLELSQ